MNCITAVSLLALFFEHTRGLLIFGIDHKLAVLLLFLAMGKTSLMLNKLICYNVALCAAMWNHKTFLRTNYYFT